MYLVSPIAQIISSPSKTKLNKSETDGWMYSKLCLVNIFFLVTTVPVILESLCFVFLNGATFVEKRYSWVEQQSSVMWAVPMTNQIFSANAKQLLLTLLCNIYWIG